MWGTESPGYSAEVNINPDTLLWNHSLTHREDKSKGESSQKKKKKKSPSLLCSAWHAGWHAPSTPPDDPQRAAQRASGPDSSPFYTNTTHGHTFTKILLKRLNRLQSVQPIPDPVLTPAWTWVRRQTQSVVMFKRTEKEAEFLLPWEI